MSTLRFRRFFFWTAILLAGGIIVIAAAYFSYPLYRDWQADRAVQQARLFLEKREIRSGLLSVRTALRHRPDHLDAHQVAAELMEAFGSPEALMHRRRLMELQPELPEAKLEYARSALRCRNSRLAAKILASVDGPSRETPEFLKLQADLFLVTGQKEKAAETYRKLLLLEPDEAAARVKLALIELPGDSEAKRASARRTLASFVSDDEFGLIALRALTQDALSRNDPSAALSWSERACQMPAAEFSDRLLRLQALWTAGSPDYESWRRELEESATANAQSAFQLGRWQLVTLGPETALSWPQGLPKNVRSTPLIGVLLADSFSALKRWVDLEDLVRWTDWHEAEALRLAFLARAQAQQDKVSRSEETWQLALAAARSRPGQLVSLAKMARADGRDVREVLWLIAEQDPAQTWARKELYEAYLKEKNSGQMLRMMELVLKEDPDDQTAKYNVAGLLMITERQLDRAARLARELYESDSKNLRNAVLYGYGLKLRGEAGKGAAILSSREDLDQLENDGRAYYALILTACGRTGEARLICPLSRSAAVAA